MQGRSPWFDQTVAGPHTLLVRADILSGGEVIAEGLPVSGGSVTGDRSQFARRTGSAVIADPAYKPSGAAGDLLAPYGNEIRLWRGAVTPAGDELIPLGTLGIRTVEFEDGGAFTGITVTGIDRCKRLQESRFPYPRTTDVQFSAIEQVRALIWEVLPGVEIRVDPRLVDVLMPQATWAENRDGAITDIMTAIGGELFCDPLGAFVLQPVPSLSDAPAFTVAGGPGGVLASARRSLTRDGVFNGVIARSSTTAADTTPVVSDLVVDDDPTSPTYWGGNFGQIVGFYESSLLTGYGQANIAARAALLNQIGAARSLNYSQAVNPAIEPGDVGSVVNAQTGATERHLHDQVSTPLAADGVMTAQTRSTASTTPLLRTGVPGGLS